MSAQATPRHQPTASIEFGSTGPRLKLGTSGCPRERLSTIITGDPELGAVIDSLWPNRQIGPNGILFHSAGLNEILTEPPTSNSS